MLPSVLSVRFSGGVRCLYNVLVRFAVIHSGASCLICSICSEFWGFFFSLIISSLLSVLWGQPWASQSPNTLQCMLGIRSRTVLFESVLAACSGLFCGWETLHLVLCSESFIGASLWRMSKSYQNSQHRISDANWSLSVSTDQKGQSEG